MFNAVAAEEAWVVASGKTGYAYFHRGNRIHPMEDRVSETLVRKSRWTNVVKGQQHNLPCVMSYLIFNALLDESACSKAVRHML
jgi:hypothetical protein